MTVKEILEAIATLSTEEQTEIANSYVTDEAVKTYLETDNGKKILQPINDSFFTKSLETWKNNNLEKLVNEKLKALNPDKDEKDIAIADLQKQLTEMQNTANREKMRNYAMTIANDKGIPTSLIDFMIADDEATTRANLDILNKAIADTVTVKVDEKIKGQHIPANSDNPEVDELEMAFNVLNPHLK